jgi:hypothetical protein
MGWICSFVEPSPSNVVASVPLTSRRMEDYLDGMDLLLCRAHTFYCGNLYPTDQQEDGGLPGWDGSAPLLSPDLLLW